MNFQNILNQIAETDPEVLERTSDRRAVIGRLGKVAALTALPFALGSIFKKAYAGGQGGSTILDTLNFALTLEYLEAEFYKKSVASASTIGIPSGAPLAAITTIRDHEVAHVAFLKSAILAAGGTPVSFTASDFDFTANGTFPDVFSNYGTFLAVAQTFEDTGVRAYKGQAGNLMSDNATLTAALRIHSVEARHASHLRQMRAAAGAAVKPWITLDQSGIPSSAVQASYDGEQLTTQAGVNIVMTVGGISIDAEAASESFDEPLTKDQVLAIVTPFLA